MKSLRIGLLSLFIVGCAHQTTIIDVPDLDRSATVVVADLRPAHERESKLFSAFASSEAYGIWRMGDATLDPSMLRLLQHRVFEKFGATQEVTVHHLVVYRNKQSELRRGALVQAVGGTLGVIAFSGAAGEYPLSRSSLVERAQFDGFAENEHRRALYTEDENPERASVFIVYLDAEIDGKRVFVRTLAPENETPDNPRPHVAAVEAAIQYFLAQFQ